jgi:uncharacterized SAM-binding protein YcdF (DUF218 family)
MNNFAMQQNIHSPFLLLKRLVVLFLTFPFLYACAYSNKAASKKYRQVQGKSFDMLVVPGVPLENGQWSRTMKGRIYWAKWLYDQGIAKNVMFSGAAVYTPYVEGEVMALYAEAIGIPKANIFTETKAEHSTENLYYSYKKAKKLGFNSIALASDPFQSKMLASYARKKVDKAIAVIPMMTDTLKALEPSMIDPTINYQLAAAAGPFVPITEREGFWKRLRGTFGSNVKHDVYE